MRADDVSRRDFIAGAASAAAASTLAAAPAGAAETVGVEALIGGLRAARVFDLGFVWDSRAPVLSLNPPYAFALNATHMLLIADHGVYLVENANLEELGAAGVNLFALVVPPLRIRGASGSPLRMLALTPKTP